MRRREVLTRLPLWGLTVAALIACGPALWGFAEDATCPKCGAPLEPGAQFCGRCGYRLEKPAVPALATPDRRSAVVQVVTVHDSELTSTYNSLASESNVQVGAILGSAFAIGPGEFVTDSGLLVGSKEVSLRTSTGRTVIASIVGTDSMIGVALLRADLKDVAPLSVRENEPPRTGESLDALGFSSGVGPGGTVVVSSGVVSGLHRGNAGYHPIEDYLQTDASLPRGLAGGPMIDPGGRVVGMSTGLVLGSRVYLGQSGIGYAVPAEWIDRALAWIRSGAPPRAWLGAYTIAVDSEARERYRLPPQAKLVIEQIFPGSPAAAAGLKRGDGLLKVQDEEVSTLPRVQERLLSMKTGEPVALEIMRGADVQHVAVTLSPRPERPRLAGIDALRFFAGLDLIPQGDDRLVVASVVPGSELVHYKIAAGDVLQSVLSKKDWLHGAKDNSRWRSVHTVSDLETRLETAYSDLDFALGLRFKSKDGTKRELYLWEILTPTAAL
ncbi:MAG TPA: trypsin-like peptidase domain-containing protein [Candidatus Dormibacteraeota bacterium]|nr:trypsin-like peptidase domain-containing protein [Candidatus Dormibacteraeota bacterium]